MVALDLSPVYSEIRIFEYVTDYFYASSGFEHLRMTKVLSTYLNQSFDWILDIAMLFSICITGSARNPDMGGSFGVPLVCSHTSPLNLKHLSRHVCSSS